MTRFVPLLILLIAAFARFDALSEDVRFHGDEAYFARYARNAAVYGDWMLSGALDKPPVSLYAAALSMQFTGVTALPDGVATLEPRRGEWSARLPAALAGIVTVALLMSAAHRLNGRRAAWLAGGLAALSPQMAGFSATAFTDPLLLVFLTASLAAALHGRGGWSGLLLAVAFATKQQAVFYAPLTALVLFAMTGKPLAWRKLRAFAFGLAAGVAALLLWDAARPDPSIFEIAADNNNPYRWLVPPDEWGGRVRLLATFISTAFGAPPVTAFVTVCALAAVFIRSGRTQKALKIRFVFPVSMLFLLFSLVYLLVHIVLPLNVYDRYLLLIYPPLILLAARTLERITPRAAIVPLVALVLMLGLTTPHRFPTDVRDRDGGLIALADFINAQGIGTVVYNRWLGWEMGYYLGAWSDKRVVFYPTPEQFAADAPRNPDPAPRLFIAPGWLDASDWLDAAQTAGFRVRTAYRSADYAAWWLER